MMHDLFDYVAATAPVDTRLASFEAIQPRADDIRAKVLRYMRNLASNGGKGVTADECADALRLDRLTVRPRFTELKKDGLIEDTGTRRKNRHSGKSAAVMNVTPKGMAQ